MKFPEKLWVAPVFALCATVITGVATFIYESFTLWTTGVTTTFGESACFIGTGDFIGCNVEEPKVDLVHQVLQPSIAAGGITLLVGVTITAIVLYAGLRSIQPE